MLYLPLENLMDTVYFHNGPMPLPPFNWLGKDETRDKLVITNFTKRANRLFCKHTERGNYVRIDHGAGPGSFADNFEGEACKACGKIFSEVQTL
jgi:hypothetical protein